MAREFFDPETSDPLTIDTSDGATVKVNPPWFTTNAGICRKFTEEEWAIVKKERDASKKIAQKYVDKMCCVQKKRRYVTSCAAPTLPRPMPTTSGGANCAGGVCTR